MTAFVKCKLGRVIVHQKLLEQGLNNFTDSVFAADMKCIHAAFGQIKGRLVVVDATGVILYRDRSAQFHLHFDEASVYVIGALRQNHTQPMTKSTLSFAVPR